ncbi:MAG: glycosyltransferase family 9 protein [Crocinitomicaceae bacterium]|nr:glycosyltransferase family 9 protein [Crocinitomicaceae bacterium]
MKRILFIQTAFLGDVILATPSFSEVKRLFPDAEIDVVVKKGNESLLSNNPNLNTVFVFDKKAGKFKEILRLSKLLRARKYEIVFNFQRFGSSGILTLLSGAKKKYGFKKNPFSFAFTKTFEHVIGDGTHEVERNLQMLQEFGAQKMVRPELFPSEQQFLSVEQYKSKKYYCLAPASVWFTKQLPEHKWLELIKLFDKDSLVYLIGGPTDFDLCEQIKQKSNQENVINLAGKLNLLESAALMKDAQRNYVNDSGPLHIASAMNAPVTAFFLSTIPAFGFGPLSDDSQILEVNDLDCRPCGVHGYQKCPKNHFKCSEISFLSIKK